MCLSHACQFPCLSSTRSQFLDCFMSQLVFFSPTGCLRTHGPAVCPPTSPKAAFYPKKCHATQPGGTMSPLSVRTKEHAASQSFFPGSPFHFHTHTHRWVHTASITAFPISLKYVFLCGFSFRMDSVGCKAGMKAWMSPFYTNGKSVHSLNANL